MNETLILSGILSVFLFGASLALLLWGDWRSAKPFKVILILLCVAGVCGTFCKTLFILLERRDTSEMWYHETSNPTVIELIDKPVAGCKKMTLITTKVKRIKVGSAEARDIKQTAADLEVKCKYAVGDTVRVYGNRIVR